MWKRYRSLVEQILYYTLQVQLFIAVFFLPLYPKLPLRKIYNTYVAIRLDDFFVIGMYAVFLAYFLLARPKLPSNFVKLFLAFFISIFVSFFLGRFVMHTIPEHLSFVGLLNTARRVQYMGFFFIAYLVSKKRSNFWMFFYASVVCMALVNIYGIGQRFFGFPAVSTMNPEFAKGKLLFLTPEARISSTFAGHYDLAAYLVLLMPVLWGLFYQTKSLLKKIFAIGGYVIALAVLFFTSSRTSFIAYLVSTPAFLLYLKKWKALTFVVIVSVILTLISPALMTRFLSTFQIKQILVDPRTGKTIIVQNSTIKELPAGDTFLKTSKSSSNALTDEFKDRLAEQKANEFEVPIASIEAELSRYETQQVVATDISMSTRFKVEWPRAIAAWQRSPLFGTGAISITEATDNDYLRWLGEFGTIGFGLFVVILLTMLKKMYSFALTTTPHDRYALLAMSFGVFGLMVNALYIDVFEASKVAYVFWILMGIYMQFIDSSGQSK